MNAKTNECVSDAPDDKYELYYVNMLVTVFEEMFVLVSVLVTVFEEVLVLNVFVGNKKSMKCEKESAKESNCHMLSP